MTAVVEADTAVAVAVAVAAVVGWLQLHQLNSQVKILPNSDV